ncbi:MAG: hypothetical protein WA869_01050 [Alloacidobacterium sp.]
MGRGRREKEAGVQVSEARPALSGLRWVRLHDLRPDGAGDQVPVFRDVQWNDRLNEQLVLGTFIRANAEGGVVLEWKADEVGDRVLRGFRKRCGLGLVGFRIRWLHSGWLPLVGRCRANLSRCRHDGQ